MDINAAVAWAWNNPYFVFAAGVASANAKTILHYAVLGVFKVPVLRAYLIGHPAEAKADLAAFVAEVDDDIDEMQAEHVAATAPPAA